MNGPPIFRGATGHGKIADTMWCLASDAVIGTIFHSSALFAALMVVTTALVAFGPRPKR